MKFTVLCKVVDNFGDIGVAWRLCKKLKSNSLNPEINLVVDNLDSFSKINKSVNPQLSFQEVEGVYIYNWNCSEICSEVFSKNDGEKLEFILELFQCGRPDWLEQILFEKKLNRTVHILMIDYLTAEKYAEDFHCLQSLTRSAKVQKINFMPGFTEKTGGLIIDEQWKAIPVRNPFGPVLFFTYEKNWKPVLKALNHFQNLQNQKNQNLNDDTIPTVMKILAAQGKGFNSVMKSAGEIYAKTPDLMLIPLNFLNQTEWDLMMKLCSVLIIRGEESLTRACLSGIPFIWHAYPQSDEYQLVKVNALLEQLKPHFPEEDFITIKKVWTLFNSPENQYSEEDMENAVFDFMCSSDKMAEGFYSFASSLRKNGDLADNLMTFINKNYII